MKTKSLLGLALAVLFLVSAIPLRAQDSTPQEPEQQSAQAASKSSKTRTFRGAIFDSECAKAGSHRMMMKKEGAKTAKECTLKCVQAGGQFVLYNRATKKTYQLDDQDQAKQFAGQRVRVTGAYDPSTQTIHVEHIRRG
ncbi:MAG: DUF5818 domain-containing protein [Terriglobia bacterium]